MEAYTDDGVVSHNQPQPPSTSDGQECPSYVKTLDRRRYLAYAATSTKWRPVLAEL